MGLGEGLQTFVVRTQPRSRALGLITRSRQVLDNRQTFVILKGTESGGWDYIYRVSSILRGQDRNETLSFDLMAVMRRTYLDLLFMIIKQIVYMR